MVASGIPGVTAFTYLLESALPDGSTAYQVAGIAIQETLGPGQTGGYSGIPLVLSVDPGQTILVTGGAELFSDPGATIGLAPLPTSLLADLPADGIGAGAVGASAVPEPASWALMAFGAAGFLATVARRRKGTEET